MKKEEGLNQRTGKPWPPFAARVFFLWMAAGVFLPSWGWCSRDSQSVPPPAPSAGQNQAEGHALEQKFNKFTLSGFTTGGKKEWDLEGESALVGTNEQVALQNITARTYQKDQSAVLTSDRGQFNKATSDIRLEEGVTVVTDDGTKLTTDHLNWNANQRIVSTDAPTRVERPGVITEGVGAEGRPDLKQVVLRKDVQVQVQSPDNKIGQLTTITCDGPLEVDHSSSTAYFYGNVLVRDPRGTLRADRMKVTFNTREKRIDKIVCRGRVLIEQGQNQTYSDQAIYLAGEGRVILTGRPKLVIFQDEQWLAPSLQS